VTSATKANDNLTILDFVSKSAKVTKIVSFAMGKLGVPSRVLSPVFGAEFTFAAIDDDSKTAVGQLSIDNIRDVWKLLGVT
jgi:3-dehydroquinate dehydratase type I